MVYLMGCVHSHMDVDDYMGMNVIGKLGKPRMNLIKAMCREKYGDRNWTADEINEVIRENELNLYGSDGRIRTKKQIQNAMSIAHEKLTNSG